MESQQNEGAEVTRSNELLESDRALVVNLESLESMVLNTMRPRPSHRVRHTRSEDHFQVIEIVRFLLERGLRFLGVCGRDLI